MNVSQSVKNTFSTSFISLKNRKGWMYLLIILLALVAFEAFNFSTTDFALSDLLGDLRFMKVRWATLLALAFCGIDFAGIARLFGPQNKEEELQSSWFMFGAWILAATMNAILTWWGVVMAMQTHSVLSVSLVNSTFISKFVPIFIALMVWVIRILLIGALSKQGEKLITQAQKQNSSSLSRREFRQAQSRAAHPGKAPLVDFSKAAATRSVSRRKSRRPEPSYIPVNDEGAYRTMKSSRATRR